MKKGIKGIILAAMLLVCLTVAACTGVTANVHELKNDKGIVLMTDDAIDVSNANAQKKLEQFIQSDAAQQTKQSLTNEQMNADIYAKGNAVVFELALTAELTAEQEALVQSSAKSLLSSTDIKEGRSDTGVDNMVVVYAVISKSGSVLASDILK